MSSIDLSIRDSKINEADSGPCPYFWETEWNNSNDLDYDHRYPFVLQYTLDVRISLILTMFLRIDILQVSILRLSKIKQITKAALWLRCSRKYPKHLGQCLGHGRSSVNIFLLTGWSPDSKAMQLFHWDKIQRRWGRVVTLIKAHWVPSVPQPLTHSQTEGKEQ